MLKPLLFVLGGFPFLVCSSLVAQTISATIYSVPGSSSGAYPISIAAGSDGALWFTEPFQRNIGRITTTGSVTEYPVPFYSGATNTEPYDIAAGPDGALWFTDNGSGGQFATIRRISTSGIILAYPVFNQTIGITTGPDGALWFATVEGSIGRIYDIRSSE